MYLLSLPAGNSFSADDFQCVFYPFSGNSFSAGKYFILNLFVKKIIFFCRFFNRSFGRQLFFNQLFFQIFLKNPSGNSFSAVKYIPILVTEKVRISTFGLWITMFFGNSFSAEKYPFQSQF